MTLYVKYKSDDDGKSAIPPGSTPWASSEIWLTDANGNTQTSPTDPNTPAAYIGANYIHVTVNSTNPTPYTGVQVQAWVCDYTAGGVGPASSRPSTNGTSGVRTQIDDPLSSTQSRVAHLTWNALSGDETKNGGHLCIAVNCYYEGQPAPDGAERLGGFLDVFNDRHYAQRNIAVLPASQKLKSLVLRLANAGVEAADFEARAWELDREGGIGAVEQELLLAHCFVDLVDGKPKPPVVPAPCQTEPLERTWLRGGGRLMLTGMPEPAEIRVAGHDAQFTVRTNRHCEDGESQGGGPVHLRGAEDGNGGDGGPGPGGGWGGGDPGGGWGGHGGDGCGAGLTIRPGELSPVLVTLECEGDPGEVHTLDIVQQTDDGTVLGGARLVAMHVPDWWSC
ncbi:hypothetical protein AB0K51_19895 [Kitasatospora sp. NPDC049285]|uniref:hypothetical protein n=1 Tax=Kitasatospora sp. NPDC049285 TaxID=3157096 RepID=UPI003435FBE8